MYRHIQSSGNFDKKGQEELRHSCSQTSSKLLDSSVPVIKSHSTNLLIDICKKRIKKKTDSIDAILRKEDVKTSTRISRSNQNSLSYKNSLIHTHSVVDSLR